jgi:group II intron reverse transcriptase/maturase
MLFPEKDLRSQGRETAHEESDSLIVPMKPVTPGEGRGGQFIASQGKTSDTPEVDEQMENAFCEIASHARKHQKLQTLMHCVNKETLKEEHCRQETGKAVGVDRATKETYEENLDENLDKLLQSMKSFSYRPQPVRRVYIPKAGTDKLRPLGIPAYEDKLVQGTMRNVLNEIYEGKFMNFSYGFRKGRSCHQAVKEVNRIIMTRKINFIVDADIKGFFDSVDHKWMMKFLGNDIADKNFLRYITRFLKAGVMEELKFHESDKGTPQGGLISPVLANVYLHYALDLWFAVKIQKHCKGEAHMVRYADDFVCFFQYEDEAKRFYEALKTRLAKFGLELAEEKSKIIRFGRNARQNGSKDSFDFLGFTYVNGKTRDGRYLVRHRTSQKKLTAKMQAVKAWLKWNMHTNVRDLIKTLNAKLRGHYQYYGISGNCKKMCLFYDYTVLQLKKALGRRSQKAKMDWRKFKAILAHTPIAAPKICVNLWK